MTVVPELTPEQFLARWPEAPQKGDVVLLDVREPQEIAIASIPGAVHVPMREIPARLRELQNDKPVVVMCHSGSRSRQVAGFLLSAGFSDVFNLSGGIDAWSQKVDPHTPRY